MQHDSSNVIDEGEVVELPEQPTDACQRSPWARAMVWVTMLSLGGSAMYAMYFRGVSRASGAMSAGNLSPMLPSDSAPLTDSLTPEQNPLPAMRADLSESGGILQRLIDDTVPRQIPLTELQRNPFRETSPASSAAAGHPTPTTAPSPQQQEAQRAAMLQAVEAMQLQSINAGGPHRSCMINDVLYDEGGIINGFTIEQINPQSVVIQNGLYHFELTLNQ